MTKKGLHSYSETIARLSAAILNAGNTIFATINQAADACGAGLALRSTTLIVFGNPKGGTPLMEALPLIALELPFKAIVWEENGSVNVADVPMSEIATRYGVTDARIANMDKALQTL